MSGELIALTEEQHLDLSRIRRIVLKTGDLPAAEVPSKKRRARTVARVMNVGDEFPTYTSLTTRQVALFELARDVETDVIQFFGEDLHGLVSLQVGDISCEIDCRASTAELREALGMSLQDCRVTAFPGLWEFAWGDVLRKTISCQPKPAEDDNFCFAGIVVYREGWRSVTSDGINPTMVDLIDGIPYIQGELKRGAVSIASALGDGLYIAHHWSCPSVSYRIS